MAENLVTDFDMDAENKALADEIARLRGENARLLNARLSQEHAMLSQQRVALQAMDLSGTSVAPAAVPLPVTGGEWWSPMHSWPEPQARNAVSVEQISCDCSSMASTFLATSTGSSVGGSILSLNSDRSSDEEGELQSRDSSVPLTTVMMRNIPNNYSRKILLDLLEEQGFRGKINLVYLPIDFCSNAGFGYAFVNFIDTESAEQFMSTLQGFRAWVVPSEKVCDVAWSSAHQGLSAHVERYRNSPMMHDSVPDGFKPVLFIDGERVPFPPPTKKIRAPRVRQRQ